MRIEDSRGATSPANELPVGETGGPVAGDPEVAELLAGYVSCCRDLLDLIPHLSKDGDWPEILRIAHRMKGSGASFGFDELTMLAREMEVAAAAADAVVVGACRLRALRYVDRIQVAKS